VRRGSKLRLALVEERDPRRFTAPRTDWDHLQGLIAEFRRGDAPVARAYLDRTAPDREDRILDLLDVWAAELADPRTEARGGAYPLRPAPRRGIGSERPCRRPGEKLTDFDQSRGS
jgi:putative DNA methylase